MTDVPPEEQPTQPVEPVVHPADGLEVFCRRCHAAMPPDASYCPRCGEARLTADDIVVETTEVLPPTRVVEEYVEEAPVLPVDLDRPAWWWPAIALGTLLLLVLLLLVYVAANDDDAEQAPPATTVPTAVPTSIVPVPVPQPSPTVVVPVPQPSPTVIVTTPTTAATTTAPTTTATTAP
jgi:hypothetical protein